MTRAERNKRAYEGRKAAGQCLWCIAKRWYRSPMCRRCLARNAWAKRNARRRKAGLPLEPPPAAPGPTLNDIRDWLASRRAQEASHV